MRGRGRGAAPEGRVILVRRLVAALLALLALACLPATAAAHATLESTVPARGAELDAGPERIELRFSESVDAGTGALRVFDGRGREVQEGEAFHPGERDDTVAIRVGELADGGFTATYRVISADSHPVSGGFSFTVGEGGAGPQSVDRLLAGTETGPVTATALGVARGVQYALIALAVGLLVFLGWVWRADGPADAVLQRRGQAILLGAGATGFVVSLLGIVLEGAQARGSTFWAALDPDVVGEVLGTRFGVAWLGAALAWLAVAGLRLRPAGAIPVGLLCLVPALGGHASVESTLMLVTNVVHVVAVGAWIGGLAVLVLALRGAARALEPPARGALVARTLKRFSTLAGATVGVVLATGVVQSVIELSALSELVDTAYGRAVLIKLGLFVVLLGFGARHRLRQATPLSLRGEFGVALVVLGVTGALATYPPGKTADVGPVSASATLGPARAELTVDPARTGVNELHVYLFDRRTGAQWDRSREIAMTGALAGRDLDLPIDLRKAGPGHYVANRAAFPAAGEWDLRLESRVSDFDQYEADFADVEIR